MHHSMYLIANNYHYNSETTLTEETQVASKFHVVAPSPTMDNPRLIAKCVLNNDTNLTIISWLNAADKNILQIAV